MILNPRKIAALLLAALPAIACAGSPVCFHTIMPTPSECRSREYCFPPAKRGKDVYSHPQFMPMCPRRCIRAVSAARVRKSGTSHPCGPA